jgi:Flp pilus assembly protein TadD
MAVEYDRRLRSAIERGDLEEAERYLSELHALAPGNAKVREALQRVQQARLKAR